MDSAAPALPPVQPIGAIARRIARQIESRLDGHRPSGDAFVVSVYGEWGVGKTYCLKGVREHFERGLVAALEALKPPSGVVAASPALPRASFVVPVWFDPWQYEHEEHLVVPLLKTIEHALRAVEERVEAREQGIPSAAGASLAQGLRRAGNVVGDVAVALASGFKFKLAPLKELTGLEVDFAPKDIFDANRAAAERRKADADVREETEAERSASGRLAKRLATRESLYFDTRQALADLADTEAMTLRFVVLVDDLDRCLPEKAIQMLESVKLFVNARGFSFVLAVDDEVVERGIAHRYRDYLATTGGPAAPISGAEYLEKIVHLPVHLQRWTADEARGFLRDHADYSALFGSRPGRDPQGAARRGPDDAAPDDADQAKGVAERVDPKTKDAAFAGAAAAASRTEADALLTFMVGCMPLVPRKLIRLAESVLFLRDHFASEGQLGHWGLGLPERVTATTSGSWPVAADASDMPLPQSRIADANAFVAQLLDADPISRRAFIEREKLDGTRLPDAAFEQLLAQLALEAHAARAVSLDWLRDVARATSPQQLLRLYQDCRVVERLLHDAPTAAAGTSAP